MINIKTKILLYIILLISLFVFVNGKIPVIGRNFLTEERVHSDGKKRIYSDLYRFSRVDYFKEEFPYIDNPGSKFQPDSADIFVFGDSFFNTMMDTVNTPMAIRNITGRNVFNSLDYKGIVFNNPLGFLNKFKITSKHRRILVLESAERYSYISALKSYLKESENYDFFYYKALITRSIMLGDTEYWLANSVFTENIINLKSSFYFDNFGIISSEISEYSMSPKFLFYDQEVNFNIKQKPEEEIKQIADNVNKLADILDRKYNMSLIYMIIPNKYTIYGKNADSTYVYDNYIPKVYSLLNENTNSINMYEIYSEMRDKNNDNNLYFTSDTHFNMRGRGIVINEVVKRINKIFNKKQDNGK